MLGVVIRLLPYHLIIKIIKYIVNSLSSLEYSMV